MKKEFVVVYLLGGLSHRFGGGIKSLAPIGKSGESLLEISMRQAAKSHPSRFVFIVGPTTKKAYEERLGHTFFNIPIHYSIQSFDPVIRDKPWGTADALCAAIDNINSAFVICNGDDLYGDSSFRQARQFLLENNTCVNIGYRLIEVVPDEGEVNRAIIHANQEGNIQGMKEEFKLTLARINGQEFHADSLCSMNFFGMIPSILPKIRQKVTKFKTDNLDDRKTECLLPQVINELITEKQVVFKVLPAQERWIGITYASDVEKAKKYFLEQ
ncbi:hypothetical protein FJZ18_01660 [Candidatus Pacearchaeota archaeon]|nr:hypothetical protein [Candidatus Pacearchaeota archaeon]